MELVPFYDTWTGSETKLDLKAIYRRPGGTGVTLTGPLPMRRHKDWAIKGFQYVCLATLGDLGEVHQFLRGQGHDPLAMRSSFDRSGAFDVAQYLQRAKLEDESFLADLQAKVDKFGADTVVEMIRLSDPAFVLPAGIKTSAPLKPSTEKGKVTA